MRKLAYILSVNEMKWQRLFDLRKIITLITAITGLYICLRYSSECAEGIRKGLLFCVEALVPSLFMFMALSSYIVKSGFAERLTKPFIRLSQTLFGMSPVGLSVILLSMIGGYPVGARCAAMLYEQKKIGRREAEKLVMIAVCAGPGFLMSYVGNALLGNGKAGRLLLYAELIGVILTGIIIGKLMRIEPSQVRRTALEKPAQNLLVTSVTDASRATFHMCAMVVLCAAMIEVIAAVSTNETLTDILSAALEITTGCQRMCAQYPLYLIAFFIGFGGISVHLQIYAGVGDLPIQKGLFFQYRILQGIITAALTYILLMIFPVEQSVFSTVDVPLTLTRSATLFGSGALILSSLCFLGSVRQIRKKSE